MPELPEVEIVCRGLAHWLEGRRIGRVMQRRPDLRFPLPKGLPKRLEGRRVLRVARRAKFILMHLDDAHVLVCHLGMSGRMLVSQGPLPALDPHDHVLIETEEGAFIRFNDSRRFGFMDLVPEPDLARHKLLAGLGPEPLAGSFDGPLLASALGGKTTPIKSALVDQRIVAGLGNIYASEALFWAAISPRRPARTVRGERADRLAAAIKRVLTEAIAAGGSSLRDFVQISGELGYFQHRWAVYDKEGQTCPLCDRTGRGCIRRIVQSGRSTFYCARRQR